MLQKGMMPSSNADKRWTNCRKNCSNILGVLGLWEATIKYMKQHLQKTARKQVLWRVFNFTLSSRRLYTFKVLIPIRYDLNGISAFPSGQFLIKMAIDSYPTKRVKKSSWIIKNEY